MNERETNRHSQVFMLSSIQAGKMRYSAINTLSNGAIENTSLSIFILFSPLVVKHNLYSPSLSRLY